VPRYNAQAAVGPGHGRGGNAGDVHVDRVVLRRKLGVDLGHDPRQVFPVDVTGALEDRERGPAERRLAARVQDIASQRHAEFVSHCVLRSRFSPASS
jgi:hypothetical protein